MIRIELNNVDDNKVETKITVEGKKSDILPEVLFFHADHFTMMMAIIDRLSPDLRLKVLFALLKEHFKVSEEWSDKD